MELLWLALGLVAACIPLALWAGSSASAWTVGLLGVLGVVVVLEADSALAPPPVDPADRARPVESGEDGYVTSRTCRACHPGEYDSWFASYHRTMTQPATAATIGGAVDAPAEAGAHRMIFERDGDGVRVGVDGAEPRDVVMLTGSHHLQLLWFDGRADPGAGALDRRMAQAPLVWLFEAERWIPRNAAFLRPPADDPGAETGRWSVVCNRRHATHARPRLRRDGRAETDVAELGIACESCHGPAASHVAAMRAPAARYAAHLGGGTTEPLVDPSDLDHRRGSEVCGQCHAVLQFHDDAGGRAWVDGGFA
jgi:hypothetical protein